MTPDGRRRLVLVGLAGAAAGCQEEVGPCEGVGIDAGQSPHTISLQWTTDAPVTSKIHYGVPGEGRRTVVVQAQAAQEHARVLVGLPALTEISMELEEAGEGGEVQSCTLSVTTQNLPAELPDFEVAIHDPQALSPELYIAGVAQTEGASYPFVLDRSGRWRWHWLGDLAISPQIQLDASGGAFWVSSYTFSAEVPDLHRVSVQGELEETLGMEDGHHAFALLPDGRYAYLATDVRTWFNPALGRKESVVGDAIIEVDLETGEAITVFSTWDWAEPQVHDYWDMGFYPQGQDWTHANALNYSEERDTYTVSMPFLPAVLEIARSSGEVVREISAETHEFASLPLSLPHDARLTAEGNLRIVNHYDEETVFVEYALDDAAGTAEVVWQHGQGLGRKAHILGQQVVLSNGNRLLSYGDLGLLQEVTPEGEEVWEVWTPLGFWFGNGQALDTLDAATP